MRPPTVLSPRDSLRCLRYPRLSRTTTVCTATPPQRAVTQAGLDIRVAAKALILVYRVTAAPTRSFLRLLYLRFAEATSGIVMLAASGYGYSV
mmetsp:Transcript_2758/g.5143  ORF Transcript_2758/g.5143 Transcript_2758/m.5143 type:complete len:93 (+) Transcript_2758:187-465(+)